MVLAYVHVYTYIYRYCMVWHGTAWYGMYVRVFMYAIMSVSMPLGMWQFMSIRYMHACMHACMHVCMHARMRHTRARTHTHTNIYVYIYIYTYACVCVKMCLFKHEHTVYRISECMQICKYEDLHICIHIYIYVETPIHTYLYMYVHTCA